MKGCGNAICGPFHFLSFSSTLVIITDVSEVNCIPADRFKKCPKCTFDQNGKRVHSHGGFLTLLYRSMNGKFILSANWPIRKLQPINRTNKINRLHWLYTHSTYTLQYGDMHLESWFAILQWKQKGRMRGKKDREEQAQPTRSCSWHKNCYVWVRPHSIN